LPVAYGICEALRSRQVYWAERDENCDGMRFRQFLEIQPGEKVLLVDDILRTGTKMTQLKQLVESRSGDVVAIAVLIHQPEPGAATFGTLPFYSLAHLDATYYKDAQSCDLCEKGVPVVKTWV
jgi:orotate phosphoribosyltransferase